MPTEVTCTGSEVASDWGGLAPTTSVAVLLPAGVPPVEHVPPFAATSVGLQMKKLIVPDGNPSRSIPSRLPCR